MTRTRNEEVMSRIATGIRFLIDFHFTTGLVLIRKVEFKLLFFRLIRVDALAAEAQQSR